MAMASQSSTLSLKLLDAFEKNAPKFIEYYFYTWIFHNFPICAEAVFNMDASLNTFQIFQSRSL